MFKKRKETDEAAIPVPAELPPLEGLDEQHPGVSEQPRRVWLWTLIVAMVAVLLIVFVILVGVKGVYDGLRDRAAENQQVAQEHYARGIANLEAGDYELAVAEFEQALRYDSGLADARTRLGEAEELLQGQASPTSETRQGAAKLLYQQAVAHYEAGSLAQSVEALEELRGVDPEYQRENAEIMLTTSHYQLGLNAIAEDRMEDGIEHFEAVLQIDARHREAQDQLNLAHLYTVALNHWERDWSASIQALKGLYVLAPDYKDVQIRLRDAHVMRAEELASLGDWCRAADEYAIAVEVLPLETTVDKRDDARINCQATAQPPAPSATARAISPTPTATSATSEATSKPTASAAPLSKGQIAFTSYDAARQRHDIFIVGLAQGDARLLRADASQPAFAPGGKLVAFRDARPEHLGLDVLNLTTGDSTELTSHAEDSTPAWSPDGSQLLFASNKHGDRKWRIYMTSPQAIKSEGEEWSYGQMPAWAPDGGRIAFKGCDERGGDCAVWTMLPGGFEPARLTSDPSDTSPAWSPDSAHVAFASARSGNWELYLIGVETGEEKRLTASPAIEAAPVWSPDGRQIAFLSDREGSWAIFILEVGSGLVRKVIAAGDAYPDPFSEQLSWLP
jgi:TolB protein